QGHYTIDDLMKHPKTKEFGQKIFATLKISPKELEKKIIDGISTIGTTLITNITKSIGNILGLVVDFVIMTFAIFFILKDGPSFINTIQEYMPFTEDEKNRLGMQIRDIIVSTVYGGLIVAIAQGIITGITIAALGFKSPVLWGTATAVVSFVPLVGAAGVWVPAAIYLFFKGSIIKGIILVIVGIFAISMIDNILKPIFIGSRTKLPVVIIFFSVLGGLSVFGLIGLVAGPLVVALFFSIIQIFKDIYSQSSEGKKA
ncbi:MAG TPA: AI-2E family transporter, partial [Nitrospirae bacterium]|nr:AI-2E family transporter [Nitrospirota bacterium]